ncbi:hypothetical protein BO70DRAFT_397385 [Aspergillus heteromorphus CBS 117.55]|uniref:Uncharacterized protein n=1 Tax=Aspergillus heteromorphus CBS 117.55 TaxID=1448321 RepID=A0A317W268_9EURO|nr:uncharacterized protein BO70DRAFT_397385 [Aspergillus heteromorphus CBS 117.55]PWY79278.1 hypothetical protein BO70DRAFT_397385 [Aspergillus heteromorphus CBS 117.55]
MNNSSNDTPAIDWTRDGDLESYVARALDDKQIPNCLWSDGALSIYGCPSSQEMVANHRQKSSAWMVPDRVIHRVPQALAGTSFVSCTEGEDCHVLDKERVHPFPDVHVHVHREGQPGYAVEFYKQSRLFWGLPPPPLGVPRSGDPFYMLVTDERLSEPAVLSRGRQPAGNHPVKILVPTHYTIGMALLALRDLEESMNRDHWLGVMKQLWFMIIDDENPILDSNSLTGVYHNIMYAFGDWLLSRQPDRVQRGHEYIYRVHHEWKAAGRLPPPDRGAFFWGPGGDVIPLAGDHFVLQ